MDDLFTFAGKGLTEADLPRLDTAARKVWDAMLLAQDVSDSGYCELNHIAKVLNIPHSTVTMCVRAFRRACNGGHTVEVVQAKSNGTRFYKLVPNTQAGVAAAKARAAAAQAGTPPAYNEGYMAGLLAARNAVATHAEAQHAWVGPKDSIAAIDKLVNSQSA